MASIASTSLSASNYFGSLRSVWVRSLARRQGQRAPRGSVSHEDIEIDALGLPDGHQPFEAQQLNQAAACAMDERLLEGERRPSSAWQQSLTLVWSKELVLKRAQWRTTIGELLLPAALCSIMIIGVAASTLDVVDAKDYAPRNIIAALATAVSPGWLFSGSLPIELPVPGEEISLATPGWVPPLWLYLTYASGVSNLTLHKRFPPFRHGGSSFAVTPDTAEAREFVEPMMARVRAAQLSFSAVALPVGVVDAIPPPIKPTYFATEADIESQAYDGETPIWAALVFHSLPNASVAQPSGPHWNYTLRFNATKVPSTRRRFDRFPTGLSTKYFNYYASGFLSLQLAVNDRVLELACGGGGGAAAPPAYGVPFPVDGYKHNLFFNFAGNLIGILVIFSLLVPLSTLLRGIVLERESKVCSEGRARGEHTIFVAPSGEWHLSLPLSQVWAADTPLPSFPFRAAQGTIAHHGRRPRRLLHLPSSSGQRHLPRNLARNRRRDWTLVLRSLGRVPGRPPVHTLRRLDARVHTGHGPPHRQQRRVLALILPLTPPLHPLPRKSAACQQRPVQSLVRS